MECTLKYTIPALLLWERRYLDGRYFLEFHGIRLTMFLTVAVEIVIQTKAMNASGCSNV